MGSNRRVEVAQFADDGSRLERYSRLARTDPQKAVNAVLYDTTQDLLPKPKAVECLFSLSDRIEVLAELALHGSIDVRWSIVGALENHPELRQPAVLRALADDGDSEISDATSRMSRLLA
jgi:hypothetical protein